VFPQDSSVNEPPLAVEGDVERYDHREYDDYYSHARALFNLFDEEEKQRLFNNIGEAIAGVPDQTVERQLALFDKVDPAYGSGVRNALGKPAPVSETALP
jgi:catalase